MYAIRSYYGDGTACEFRTFVGAVNAGGNENGDRLAWDAGSFQFGNNDRQSYNFV